MKTPQNQLDLFPQDLPQESPSITPDAETTVPAPLPKETAPFKPQLSPIHCSRCGDWLCDALAGARSYCPRCRIWSCSGEPIPEART